MNVINIEPTFCRYLFLYVIINKYHELLTHLGEEKMAMNSHDSKDNKPTLLQIMSQTGDRLLSEPMVS